MGFSLGGFLRRMVGGGGEAAVAASDPVEYKGFRIRATPLPRGGQFQTSGVIEKDTAEGTKSHSFIRADTHGSRDDAESFSITKAKQIIDEQGERVFKPAKPPAS